MKWLENFMALVRQYYRPSYPTPVELGEITPNDMALLIVGVWPNAVNEGKVKIRSAKYKRRTWDSIERFALHTKVANRYRPFTKHFRECGHFAADLAGQFYHNKQWQGQAIGTIIYMSGVGWHEVNIVFGGDPPTMRFWEAQDGVWTTRVAGAELDTIWIP